MQVNKKIILLCFLIVLIFIFGCSSQNSDNIRQSVLDYCMENYKEINDDTMNIEEISDETYEKLMDIDKIFEDLTEEELELIISVSKLAEASLQYVYADKTNNEILKDRAFKTYIERRNNLKINYNF